MKKIRKETLALIAAGLTLMLLAQWLTYMLLPITK
jgi:hypothetical protein